LASGSVHSNKSGEGKEEIDFDTEMPAAKRQRQSLPDSPDAEEEMLYSPERAETSPRKTFAFAVRDSLVNIGPLRDFAQGLRLSADMEAAGVAKQSNYELVACSGHGKNGSVSVLHQSIRPDLITDVNLGGCIGVWTVYYTAEERPGTSDYDDTEYHAYLIISLNTRTMILETGDTLGEVTEKTDYYIEGPTILAGNLFKRRRILQVYAKGVRVLDGALKTQDVPTFRDLSESPESEELVVVSAAVADPYVLLQMNNGSAQITVGVEVEDSLELRDIWCPSVLRASAGVITACSLFVDKAPGCWMKTTTDILKGVEEGQADVFCIICRENGNLEIFGLSEVTCIFVVKKFVYGRTVLSNYKLPGQDGAANGSSDGTDFERELQEESELTVTSVHMETWGKTFGRPFLFAILSDGTMLCYHAYSFEVTEGSTLETVVINEDEVSPTVKDLHFVRLPVDWVISAEQGNLPASEVAPKFVSFKHVGNEQGLFVTGPRPAWLMVCRERIRVHPQFCDGAILAFTPLHNVNCTHGLIYATNKGSLRICQLPALTFDNDWPLQKIPIKSTPHQITYLSDVGFYALIISTTVVLPPRDKNSVEQYAGPGGYPDNASGGEDSQRLLSIEEFEVRIVGQSKSGGLWETKGSLPMQEQENAVTVRIVAMKTLDQDTTQNLLAIGTAYAQGEDTPARGRIILVAVGGDLEDASFFLRELYSKEMKGSISAIASIQGNLLVAIGAKIILHTWNGSELNGAAFFDAPLYVVSLNIVKNFVLFGDIHKSIYFLNWKEEGAQLQILAKDFTPLDCTTSEFLIDGGTLSLLVADSHKNVQIFSYAPKSMESWKGQKLLSRAEFHLGAHVAKFLRLQMLPTGTGNRSNKFAVLCGTLDGGIDCLAPLDELTFRRLQTLQKKLVDVVPHVGGLNPRAFRQFQSSGRAHRPGPDNIVDCELLGHYTLLPLDQQRDVARQIGTTRVQILSNIRDLSLSTSFL
jgi:cleavage and polyadenylation specificity factor subunit 1